MIFIYKLHLMIVLTFILYRRILIKKKKKEKEQKEPVYQHPNGITQDSRKKKNKKPDQNSPERVEKSGASK